MLALLLDSFIKGTGAGSSHKTLICTETDCRRTNIRSWEFASNAIRYRAPDKKPKCWFSLDFLI